MLSAATTTTPTSAEAWLQLGHHAAASGRVEDLRIALDCYDRAREAVPGDLSDPDNLQALALTWLNRGNVLQQLGPAHFGAAHTAYDAASAALASLELTAERRLNHSALHTNRGRLYLRENRNADARDAFQRVLVVLRPAFDDPTHGATARRQAAGAAINLAQTYFSATTLPERDTTLLTELLDEIRTWLQPIATTDAVAGTLALEAARLELVLREHLLDAETFPTFTDRLEEALVLAATWLDRDHPTARELAPALFRLGAFAYARHQPHFLLEFLQEALDPSLGPAPFADRRAFHQIAADALTFLRIDLERPRVLAADAPAAHAVAALHHELSVPLPWLDTAPPATTSSCP